MPTDYGGTGNQGWMDFYLGGMDQQGGSSALAFINQLIPIGNTLASILRSPGASQAAQASRDIQEIVALSGYNAIAQNTFGKSYDSLSTIEKETVNEMMQRAQAELEMRQKAAEYQAQYPNADPRFNPYIPENTRKNISVEDLRRAQDGSGFQGLSDVKELSDLRDRDNVDRSRDGTGTGTGTGDVTTPTGTARRGVESYPGAGDGVPVDEWASWSQEERQRYIETGQRYPTDTTGTGSTPGTNEELGLEGVKTKDDLAAWKQQELGKGKTREDLWKELLRGFANGLSFDFGIGEGAAGLLGDVTNVPTGKVIATKDNGDGTVTNLHDDGTTTVEPGGAIGTVPGEQPGGSTPIDIPVEPTNLEPIGTVPATGTGDGGGYPYIGPPTNDVISIPVVPEDNPPTEEIPPVVPVPPAEPRIEPDTTIPDTTPVPDVETPKDPTNGFPWDKLFDMLGGLSDNGGSSSAEVSVGHPGSGQTQDVNTQFDVKPSAVSVMDSFGQRKEKGGLALDDLLSSAFSWRGAL